jgi:hypothetical protein
VDIEARKGAQVAAVAVARKIACLCWQLLTKEEDYAFARPSLMRVKIRRAELDAGAPRRSTRHGGRATKAGDEEQAAEQEMVDRAEAAYRRLVADWQSTGAKGAGATRARIFWALYGASSAAGISHRACALARWSPAPA